MLIDALRDRLEDPEASSFRLMGEDLQLLTIDELRTAVAEQAAAISPSLRDELHSEERSALSFTARFSTSVTPLGMPTTTRGRGKGTHVCSWALLIR